MEWCVHVSWVDGQELDSLVAGLHVPDGGQVAERGFARAVGAPPHPCHRVLGSGANPGGYSGGAGLDTKLALLALEGARPSEPDLFGRN